MAKPRFKIGDEVTFTSKERFNKKFGETDEKYPWGKRGKIMDTSDWGTHGWYYRTDFSPNYSSYSEWAFLEKYELDPFETEE